MKNNVLVNLHSLFLLTVRFFVDMGWGLINFPCKKVEVKEGRELTLVVLLNSCSNYINVYNYYCMYLIIIYYYYLVKRIMSLGLVFLLIWK